jgi:hypothetical protein
MCNVIWREKEESVTRQVLFSLSLARSYSLLSLFTTIYGTRVEREYCHFFFHNRILIVPLAFFRSGKQQDEKRKRDDAEQMLSTFNFSFSLS